MQNIILEYIKLKFEEGFKILKNKNKEKYKKDLIEIFNNTLNNVLQKEVIEDIYAECSDSEEYQELERIKKALGINLLEQYITKKLRNE